MLHLQSDVADFVEGYEHVAQMASQQPDSYLQMAEFYREQMRNAASALDPTAPIGNNKENAGSSEEQLNRNLDLLKMELQSISHERVIVDVLTRNTMAQSRHAAGLAASAPSSSSSSSSSSSRRYRVTSSSPAAAPLQHHQQQSQSQSQTLLDGNIPIPDYSSAAADAAAAAAGAKSDSTESRLRKAEQRKFIARKVPNGGLMVPSLRQGSLPPELQMLRTTPTAAPPVLSAEPRPARRKPKRADAALQGFAQAVRSFKSQLQSSQQDLESLKAHVDTKASTEKSGVQRQLRSLLTEVKQQQEEQGRELLGEVDRAVDSAMGRLAQLIKPQAEQKRRLAAQLQQQQAVLQAQGQQLEEHRERQRQQQREVQQRMARDRASGRDPREARAAALRSSNDSTGSARSAERTGPARQPPPPPPPPPQLPPPASAAVVSVTAPGYRVLVPRPRGGSGPRPAPVLVSQEQAEAMQRGATSRGAALPAPFPATNNTNNTTRSPPSSPSRGRGVLPPRSALALARSTDTDGERESEARREKPDPRAVRFETRLVGDSSGVQWATQATQSTPAEPSLLRGPPPAPAPSLHELQHIPGSNYETGPVAQVAPADLGAHIHAHSHTHATNTGGYSSSVPRQMGVISDAALVTIAGASRPRMQWEEERENESRRVRLERARLSTEIVETDRGEVYSVAAPLAAEHGVEGFGAAIRVGSFYSKVTPRPVPDDAPAAAASSSSSSSSNSSSSSSSSYAQDRQLGRHFERLLDTVVDGQRLLVTEVLSSQARLAEEIASSRRDTLAAAVVPAAVQQERVPVQQPFSEDKVIALVHQYMEAHAAAAPAVLPASAAASSAAAQVPEAAASHEALEALAARLDSRLQQALSDASEQSKEERGALSAQMERREAEHHAALLAAMEDGVRRGIEEGLGEGVRRTLEKMQALREAEAEEEAAAAALAPAPAASTSERRRDVALGRSDLYTPASFDLLQAIQQDAAESRAAAEAVRRGLGADLYSSRGSARARVPAPFSGAASARAPPRATTAATAAAADDGGSDDDDDDEAWLDQTPAQDSLSTREVSLVASVEVDVPGGASSRRMQDQPEELSEEVFEDASGSAVEWSLSEDDGDVFLQRHVDPKLLFTDKGKANLRWGDGR